MEYTPDKLQAIRKIYSDSQIWRHRKEGAIITKGSLVVYRYQGTESRYDYSRGWYECKTINTKFGIVNSIINDANKDTVFNITVYDSNLGVYSSYISKYERFTVKLYKVIFSEDEIAKDTVKYEKKQEKLKLQKIKEEEEQQKRIKEAQEEEERERKEKEECERKEKEQRERKESERRSQTMEITVGMWEDLKKTIKDLESRLSRTEEIAEDVDWRTSYHGDEE